MKKFNKTSGKRLAGVVMVSLITLVLSSCIKNKTDNYTAPSALVNVTQASPDEPPIDISFDNDMLNSSPLNFGGHLDYFKAYVGKRNINVYNHTTNAKILTDTITLAANVPYSMFLANKASSPELFWLKDSVSNPGSGKASIRFINLSPDAPAVDFAVSGGSVLAANKKYKGFSSFIPVTGNQNYTIQVLQAGTSTVLTSLTNLTLANGFVYTIYLRGLVASTSTVDQLSASLIVNAVYY